ncbi:MAG: response regulator transcription factor [Cyanobacteria bacterium J06649_11]
MIHIAIIEDDPKIRNLYKELINLQQGFSCHHLYESVEEALKELPHFPYIDVVLIDIGLPGVQGDEGIRLLKQQAGCEKMNFIVVTVQEDDEVIFRALKNGAVGYLLKNSGIQIVLTAIEQANSGGAPMSMKIARKVLTHFHQFPTTKNPLTPKETKVLKLLGSGKVPKEIAGIMEITYEGVRSHNRNIYKKLEVSSRGELLAEAKRRGLIE